MSTSTKRCARCKQSKSTKHFHRCGAGWQAYCIPCKKEYHEEHLEQEARYQKAYRERNPRKIKAHKAVEAAVKNGTLIKPPKCEDCKKKLPLEAHHKDYSKPLDVDWLCSKCHVKADGRSR